MSAAAAERQAAERRRIRRWRAMARLSAAATALIDLRELTEPGPHRAWLDSQIGALLGAREVLESSTP